MRLLLPAFIALLLTGCGRPYVTCTDEETRALLSATFKQEVLRVLARDYGDLSPAGLIATQPIAAEFAGLRKLAGEDSSALCKGEAVVSVKLDPVVARRLTDPLAAIYLPNELGDTKVVGDELRGMVKYALVPGDQDVPTVDASVMTELASAAAIFTMQVVSEQAARSAPPPQ